MGKSASGIVPWVMLHVQKWVYRTPTEHSQHWAGGVLQFFIQVELITVSVGWGLGKQIPVHPTLSLSLCRGEVSQKMKKKKEHDYHLPGVFRHIQPT